MKNTKIVIIKAMFLVLVLSTIGFSQDTFSVKSVLNAGQVSQIEKAVDLYWNPKSKKDPNKAVDLLDEISKSDPNNWVAPYWASYISTQIYRSGPQNSKYIDRAQELIHRSYKVFEKKPDKSAKAYFYALQSLIFQFKGFEFARSRDLKTYKVYMGKAEHELDLGLDLSPENPVLMVMLVSTQLNPMRVDFGEIVSMIALLEKAKMEFKKIKDRSPADIAFWNEHWIGFWLGRAKTLLNMTTFNILSVPEKVRDFKWVELKKDAANDGVSKQSADGKALSYFYKKDTDMLWFKFDLHNQISIDSPAVSISFDTDADQSNGTNWFGENSRFKYEKIVSIGPTKKRNIGYFGYNGITDEKGARRQNWMNVKKRNVTFFYSKETNSYFLGVKRSDIDPDLKKFNVIGSVGQKALRNDDIGEEGFSTIDLKAN